MKILIIAKTRITSADSMGVSVGRWFCRFKREEVAHLYSGGGSGRDSLVTDYEYKVTGHERWLGGIFDRIKPVVSGSIARPKSEYEVRMSLMRRTSAILWGLGSRLLVQTGLFEIIFKIRLSSSLCKWIEEFKPDIIYSHPADISFMELTLAVSKKFNIPVCVHVMDDYPKTLYANTCVSAFIRPYILYKFRQVLSRATCCMVIGDDMAVEYIRRYKRKFEVIGNCEIIDRYTNVKAGCEKRGNVVSIIYSGSLYLGRWLSIIDVARAARNMAERTGRKFQLDIYTSLLERCALNAFREMSNIKVHDIMDDRDVPGLLAGADILIIAEGFSNATKKHIMYSVSSKAQLCMLSGRPTIVYGPECAGTIKYAKRENWAIVVEKQGDIQAIENAIELALSAEQGKDAIVTTAKACALKYHDEAVVGAIFRASLHRTHTVHLKSL